MSKQAFRIEEVEREPEWMKWEDCPENVWLVDGQGALRMKTDRWLGFVMSNPSRWDGVTAARQNLLCRLATAEDLPDFTQWLAKPKESNEWRKASECPEGLLEERGHSLSYKKGRKITFVESGHQLYVSECTSVYRPAVGKRLVVEAGVE